MRWFNGMVEDVDEAVRRLDDIGVLRATPTFLGWSQVGNTPLKWYKQNTHGGGVRDPLVVHWPRALSRGARGGTPRTEKMLKEGVGAIRRSFCHAIDIMPTILELTGTQAPTEYNGVAQMPLHGASLAPTLSSADAKTARTVQYFEMLGHRGIWKDGWKAVVRHVSGTSWDDDDQWELYHLDEDFSETNDLAEQQPERLRAMIELWWEQAEMHGVLPLDDRPARRRSGRATAGAADGARPVRLLPARLPHRGGRVPLGSTRLDDASRACAPTVGGDGALVNRGTINSGFAFYILGGRLHFDYNCFHAHTTVAAPTALVGGERVVAFQVERLPGRRAAVRLLVDGDVVADGEIPLLLGMLSSTGMDLGRATAPVNRDYQPPFAYPGKIRRVTFELPKRRTEQDSRDESQRQARAAMARQ